MAWWDDFKKYFGVGEKGFGKFGSQVKDRVVTPVNQRVVQPTQKFVRQNPTPASFVNRKVVQPTIQRVQPRIQQTYNQVKPTFQDIGRNLWKYQTGSFVNDELKNLPVVPKTILKAPTGARNLAKTALQAIPRGVTQLYNQTAPKDKQIEPKSRIGKIIYGDQPVGDVTGRYKVNKEFMESKGIKGNLATGLGAGLTGLALTADVVPFGSGGSSIAKKLAKATKADDVIKILGKTSKAAKDKNLVTKLVKETNPKNIENMISRAGKVVKPSAKELRIQRDVDEILGKRKIKVNKPKLDNTKAYEIGKPNPNKVAQINADEARNMGDIADLQAIQGDIDNVINKYVGGRRAAETEGARIAYKYNVPKNKFQDVVSALEGNKKVDAPTREVVDKFRKAYDEGFKRAEKLAKETGGDIRYLQDYLTHVWKESPAEILAIKQKRLGKSFKFAKDRAIKSYDEGVKLGLTPRYSNPAQMLGEYHKQLEITKNNLNLFNKLKDQGYIVPSNVGYGRPGFAPVNASGFPRRALNIDGKIVEGQWYAPQEVAEKLNKLFSPQQGNKLLAGAADISGKVQTFGLSGGLPGTNVNFFTAATGVKEALGGRGIPFSKAFAISNNPAAANKYFFDNAKTIKEIQKTGINFSTGFTINDAVKGKVRTGLGEKVGDLWNKVFEDATFKRYMPVLQTEYYKDVKNSLLKGGATEKEAIEKASQALKNWHGLGNAGSEALQDPNIKNLVKLLFLAPKYRGTMVKFWGNTAKSLLNPFAKQNRTNAMFLVGAGLTYLGMTEANKKLTGKYMHENPSYKKDKLLVPLKNGKTIGVPFLPSIATLPRAAANVGLGVAKGDVSGAIKEGTSSTLSMFLKGISEAFKNEDYFGRPIYDENASAGKKYTAMANHVLNPFTGAWAHPYTREGYKFAKGKQGLTETISTASEMPLRWYDTEKVKGSAYYDFKEKRDQIMSKIKNGEINEQDGVNEIQKLNQDLVNYENRLGGKQYDTRSSYSLYKEIETSKLNDEEKRIFDRHDKDETKNAWESISRAADYLSNPKVFQAKAATSIKTALQDGKDVDPLYKLPQQYQQEVLLYQATPVGSEERKGILARSDWLPDFWEVRSQYFDGLNLKGSETSDYPAASPEMQQKLDYYYSLPYGTGQRSNFIKANPDLVTYWDRKKEYNNKKRAEMGLPPLEDKGYSKYGRSSGGRKLKAKKMTITDTTAPTKKVTVSVPKSTYRLPKTGVSSVRVPRQQMRFKRPAMVGRAPRRRYRARKITY